VIRDLDWTTNFNRTYDFTKDGFVCSSMTDYFSYMTLCHKYKDDLGPSENNIIHASQKVDIAWHSHMLNTKKYNDHSFITYYGHVDHDPWPDYDEEMMKEVCNNSKELWKQEFGVDYVWSEK